MKATTCSVFATMFRCVSTAPLDTPVVPPVYCRKATSSPDTSTGSSSSEAPFASSVVEAHRARQRERRHHLPDLADHEVGDRGLREAEHVADAGHDHLAHRRARDHLLERRRRVLEDDDHGRARVLELVLELARRVERVDVDDDAARAVRAHDRDRVLQEVRHHDRDAVAPDEAGFLLQPGAEPARLLVELARSESVRPMLA